MKLLQLHDHIRARAAQFPRPASLQNALATLTGLARFAGPEGHALRAVLKALCTPDGVARLTEAHFASVGPLAACSLDIVLAAMTAGALKEETLQAKLQPFFVDTTH